MNTIKLMEKIDSDINEYGYVLLNMDCVSQKLANYKFNISVAYNKNFSDDMKFVVRNACGRILLNDTIDIKDLDWFKNILNNELF